MSRNQKLAVSSGQALPTEAEASHDQLKSTQQERMPIQSEVQTNLRHTQMSSNLTQQKAVVVSVPMRVAMKTVEKPTQQKAYKDGVCAE